MTDLSGTIAPVYIKDGFWGWFFDVHALAGGVIIGLASGLLYFGNGRIAGISGIIGRWVGSLFPFPSGPRASMALGEWGWRLLFLMGLLAGGILINTFIPQFGSTPLNSSPGLVITAGLLVGVGTRMGLGCTSGHGVCGIGRMSVRSIFATVLFIAAGMVTVALVRTLSN
jgi:uncharacterized membrane protein YedE/YeeE